MTSYSTRPNTPRWDRRYDEDHHDVEFELFESMMVPEAELVENLPIREIVPVEFPFEEDDDLDYELIPETDVGNYFYLPIVFLSLVSVISVLGVWFAIRYSRPGVLQTPPQPIAAASEIYPTSTTISGSLKHNEPVPNGALESSGEAEVQAESPLLIPTASPSPPPVIIPKPVYGFKPDEVKKEFVTDKMVANMNLILNSEIPARNYLDVHLELTNLSQPSPKLPTNWQIGQQRTINVVGKPVSVRLMSVSENAYLWADERLRFPTDQYSPVANRLDEELYPKVISLFGPESSPGIDGDPRFHIFHLATLESRELGFFDSSDVYPREIFADSNENEAIYINMESLQLGDQTYYGTLVHELQHLIRWSVDRNEETWLDEGLSQVTEIYSGFNSFTVDDYLRNNSVQLNDWSYESHNIYSHYGGSALFVVYLWEQLGSNFIRTLSQSPYDGMAAVSKTLNQSGNSLTLQSVFQDWLVAVYKNDPLKAESRYGFSQYEFEPPAPHQIAQAAAGQPFSDLRKGRPQFSGWYVDLPSNQNLTISFAGDSVQSLYPSAGGSNSSNQNKAFYVPPRNRMSATLHKDVDLRGVINPSITFDSWYNLEDGFDHMYLMVSADRGNSWTMLQTSEMKQGTYGPGLTGNSGVWISQSASLAQWSGREIIVQFQLLTDSAVRAQGFALDNITLAGEETATLETNAGGWIASGFVRTGNLIPQNWIVSIAHEMQDGQVWVETLTVDEFGELKEDISTASKSTLIIAPASPLTHESADFWFSVE